MKRYWINLLLLTLIACQPVTPISTPTLESPITPSPEVPVKYELQQPNAKDLLGMIDIVLLAEKEWEPSVDELYFSAYDRAALHSLIGRDFERYYSNGFPGADDLIIKDTLPWEQGSWEDLGSFSPVLRIAFLEYINKHQEVLENGMPFELPNANIKTFSMDLDGDGNLEWLIGVEYFDYSLLNWLLITKQADGLYHLLPSFEADWTLTIESFPEIVISDFTGDGRPEIAKVSYSYGAGKVSGIIRIFTWMEDKLVQIESISLPGTPPVYYGISEYVVADLNADGVAEVHVDSPQFRGFGCEWVKSSVYYLDGRDPVVEVIGEEIPKTNDCLIARALESNDTEEKVRLYQEAIENFDLNTTPLDRLAWLKLHLAMAYTALGRDGQASFELKELIDMNGDGQFLKYIKDTYSEYNSPSPSPLALCDTLYSAIAIQDIPDNLGSEIDADLTHWAYPVDYAPIPDLICPFPEVLTEKLDRLKISTLKSPVDALVLEGYPLEWSRSLDWDNDSVDEWAGLLKFGQPILVFMNGDKYWEINSVEISLQDPLNIVLASYVPDGSTGSMLLVLVSGEGRYCDLPDTTKWLIEINPDTFEYESAYLCDANTYSLESKSDIQFALQEFLKPKRYETIEMPDWYYLPEFIEDTYQQKTILDVIGELEDKIVDRMDTIKVTRELYTLINSLPDDDPLAKQLFPRLYYLRGLNYELNGEEKMAIDSYFELIEQFPESLWSEYARIRIKPAK